MATFVGATLYDGDDIDDYLAANHITPRRSVGGLVFQKFQEYEPGDDYDIVPLGGLADEDDKQRML